MSTMAEILDFSPLVMAGNTEIRHRDGAPSITGLPSNPDRSPVSSANAHNAVQSDFAPQ